MSDDNKIIPFRRPENGANGHANGHSPRIRVRVDAGSQIGPELSGPGDPDKESFLQRLRKSPVTALISIINVAYFLWIEQHGSSQQTDILLRFGAVQSDLVRSGDYWRIAGYMIVHIGWGHLVMNTWAGGSWCLPVERMMGSLRFFLLYAIAGIGGGAAVCIFSNSVTAGASGAMFGVIGALLTIRYRQLPTWRMFTSDRGVRSTVGQIALWTVLGVVALPMSQAGHFGGLITGALFTYAMTMRAKKGLGYAAFALAFAGFLAYATQPWAKTTVDWTQVHVSRLGTVENPREVMLQAIPACARGVERACVIKTILSLEHFDSKGNGAAIGVFEPACKHGDKDACAGLGLLLTDRDMVRSIALTRQACAAGSEWGCDFVPPDLSPGELEKLPPPDDEEPAAADASAR